MRPPADGRNLLNQRTRVAIVLRKIIRPLVTVRSLAIGHIFFQRTFWFACSLVLLNVERISGRSARHEGAPQPRHP
jgi:hypothetical protein